MEIVRNVAGDLVEHVECIDVFTNPKTQRISKCFRISYRSLERTLLNEEIDEFQFRIRDLIREELKVELR
jgi:phenylalanyl-tRNA synthetase alpha chain